jgi:hypothetical protein
MENSLDSTKKILAKIDYVITGIAILKNIKDPKINIDTESARIERCVEHHFLHNSEEIEYNEFVLKFLTENYNDLVHTDKFNDLYLDNIKEPVIKRKR